VPSINGSGASCQANREPVLLDRWLPAEAPLSAPLEVGFGLHASRGPVLSRFVTALRDRRVEGVRGSDGRVHVAAVEYDPVTGQPLKPSRSRSAPEGTVVTWSGWADPLEGQPLATRSPGRFRLDGADTALLHAVDAGSPAAMRTGCGPDPWAEQTVGHIRDIACFEPVDAASPEVPAVARPEATADPVTMITYAVAPALPALGLAGGEPLPARTGRGSLLASAARVRQVYIPPRGACPTDGVPTREEWSCRHRARSPPLHRQRAVPRSAHHAALTCPPTCCWTGADIRSCTGARLAPRQVRMVMR